IYPPVGNANVGDADFSSLSSRCIPLLSGLSAYTRHVSPPVIGKSRPNLALASKATSPARKCGTACCTAAIGGGGWLVGASCSGAVAAGAGLPPRGAVSVKAGGTGFDDDGGICADDGDCSCMAGPPGGACAIAPPGNSTSSTASIAGGRKYKRR